MLNNPNPNYSRGQNMGYAQVASSPEQASALLSRVSYLLCTALLVTAGGCYLGQDMSPALWPVFAIGTFVCVIALRFARANPALGLGLLYALSLMEGLMLAPLINSFIKYVPEGATYVGSAFALTAIIVGGLGTYVWISSKDFGFLGKSLFWALIGLIVISFIGIFFRPLFANAHLHMLYLLAGVAIFVGFTLYDFSNIKLRYGPNDYIIATVQVYLDFLNIFLFILQILGMSGGSRRS